jgi:hypothetical protein
MGAWQWHVRGGWHQRLARVHVGWEMERALAQPHARARAHTHTWPQERARPSHTLAKLRACVTHRWLHWLRGWRAWGWGGRLHRRHRSDTPPQPLACWCPRGGGPAHNLPVQCGKLSGHKPKKEGANAPPLALLCSTNLTLPSGPASFALHPTQLTLTSVQITMRHLRERVVCTLPRALPSQPQVPHPSPPPPLPPARWAPCP